MQYVIIFIYFGQAFEFEDEENWVTKPKNKMYVIMCLLYYQ